MKSQTLNLITRNQSDKQILLSVGLLVTVVSTNITLPVNAQSSNQDSFLPPEVIPTNQATTYGTSQTNTNSKALESNQTTPQQSFQTPQEARQAIYSSLMGNNVYPQFNGQTSYNDSNSAMNGLFNQNISNQNMPTNQVQNLGQSTPQNLNNQMNTTANNYQNNVSPPQTQTLSGAVSTQSTSQQRTTGGISHLAGVVAGFAACGVALAGMRSTGGIYSAGLLGGGMANYGMNSGFRF